MAKVLIGELIDLLYAKRADRLSLQHAVDKLKAEEADLKFSIMKALNSSKLGAARGLAATASITMRPTVELVDWTRYWPWVRKNDELGMYIHKRVAVEPLVELLSDDKAKPIPGVELASLIDLSVTKAPASAALVVDNSRRKK